MMIASKSRARSAATSRVAACEEIIISAPDVLEVLHSGRRGCSIGPPIPYQDRRRALGLRRGSCALGGPCAGEHRSGIAVQDLLARFRADLCIGERLPGPVAAELGAVGAADDG